MKQIFSAFLAALFVTSSVVLPPQAAQAVSLVTAEMVIQVAGQELKLVSRTGKAGEMIIDLLDSSGNTVMSKSVVTESASKEALQAKSPSSLASLIANNEKKSNGRKAWEFFRDQTFYSFPVQSFSFYLAIGATVAEQVILNYSQDPVGFEHFFNQQLDPVGQMSFYAFMLANDGSSHAMASLLNNGKMNPRLAPFIPYMGMSLGMIASNIVSEALHSENFKACSWSILSGKGSHSDVCEKAYSAWTESGGMVGIANEWAPGLISLVATTIATSAIQQGLMMLTSTFFKTAGIELATFAVPGGLVVKSLRAAGFVAQLTLFTRVNNAIDPVITKFYQNFIQSGKISDLETSLITDLSNLRARTGSSDQFSKDLTQFAQTMKAWRSMNLLDVNTAQSSWIENLNNFAGLYNAAKGFDEAIIGELVNQKRYPTYTSPLFYNFPLNGITPNNFNEQRIDAFMNEPDKILPKQLETVKAVSQKLDQMYASHQAFLSGLSSGDRNTLLSILAALRSQDPKKIGQAMDVINFKIKDITESHFGFSNDLATALKSIRDMLGKPKPIWEKSSGYAAYFLLTQKSKSSQQLSHQEKFWFNAVTYNLAQSTSDWLIASTLWGPDISKNEKLTDTTAGFYSQFLAPRLPITSQSEYVCAMDALAPTNKLSICDQDVRYDNPLHFVATHVQPSMIDNSVFEKWWSQNAETAYVKVWVDFENKYQEIVAKLMSRFWDTDDSSTNRSDISNGIFKSAIQEVNLYSVALGGVMKNRLEQADKKGLMDQALSQHANFPIKKSKDANANHLLSVLLQSDLDADSVLGTQGIYRVVSPGPSRNFVWQNMLIAQLGEYEDLLKQMKPVTVRLSTGDEINAVSSQITNAQLKEQHDKIAEILKYAAQWAAGLNLSSGDAKIAELCLKNIESVVQEITTTAMIVNSVSYRELTASGGQVAKARCTQTEGASNGFHVVQNAAEGCSN